MSEVTPIVEKLSAGLMFHRRMVILYFSSLAIIAASFIYIETINTRRSYDSFKSISAALSKAPSEITVKFTGDGDAVKNFVGTNEITIDTTPETMKDALGGSVKISMPALTIIMMVVFAIYGLIRHHLRRINTTEDRLFILQAALSMTDDSQEIGDNVKFLSSIILSGQSVNEPAMHPISYAIDGVAAIARRKRIHNKKNAPPTADEIQ